MVTLDFLAFLLTVLLLTVINVRMLHFQVLLVCVSWFTVPLHETEAKVVLAQLEKWE